MRSNPTTIPFRFGKRAGFVLATGRVFPLVAGGDGPVEGDEPEAVFELPEDLTADSVTPEQLDALLTEATAAFDAIYDEGTSTPEAQAALAALADAVDLVRTEQTRRTTEAEAAATAAAELAARVHPTPDTPEGELPEGEQVAELPEGEELPEGGELTPEPTAEVPELVTAAAPRPGRIRVPLGAVSRRTAEQPAQPEQQRVTITASSDVPGVSTGSQLDMLGLRRAMSARARGLRNGSDGVVVASIERPGLTRITDNMSTEEIGAAMDQLVASGLAGGLTSLLASGGWCAPSQVLYDFFDISAADGLWDTPTLGIDRAGITWPVSPSIADALSAPWLWTEAQDVTAAGNPHVDPDDDETKPCVVIPCPTYAEARLRAHGICLTHGNLADRAFPEARDNFVGLVLNAHEHLMSYRNIAVAVAASTAVAVPSGGTASTGAAPQLLNAIELQVIDYRSKYRMSEGAVLEAVFPSWVIGAIRADLAQRQGTNLSESLAVSDEQVRAWFTLRGVRPQFVQDWLPLQTGTGEVGGGDGYAEAYPSTVKFLLYAAGTFVRGIGPVIDLGVVRDSALNATNDHTAVWTEETDLIAKRGHESRVVTVPLDVSGRVYARSTYPTS